ncbi:NADAR domain-containing protein [Streptomyces sp. NPDC058401]|uniref:NADAR domain-containing protein n=1 Tax=Streptomyces sp. NPDC058401 TaxID=3346480 RepID=UPI0036664F99
MADPGLHGLHGLRNDYPTPVAVREIAYLSVADAYWTLSLARIWSSPGNLVDVVRDREGWEHARTAVMAGLLRAKYDRYPELAEILLATGDAHLLYEDSDSAFWGDDAGRGRNWTGRLLELVRAELHLRRAGIPGL